MDSKALENDQSFMIGKVSIVPLLGDVRQLEADVLVQSSGTSVQGENHHSSWIVTNRNYDEIVNTLNNHRPHKLGDVIISTAGSFHAKYLFNAIVIDWGHQRSQGSLIYEDIVDKVARKCIEVAVSLDLKSIAFLPWGARIGASTASMMTALLVQAIVTQLKVNSGSLERVFLISNNKEHYQWFVDRAFLFQVMFSQIEEIRNQISHLDVTPEAREQILETLGNLTQTVYIFNEVVEGDKITVGNMENVEGAAIGNQAMVKVKDSK
ncbi:macro domain-containing protein [Candidatus Leptofilum sp.]|uniref:macro domain-containing protein n=1 Tax=Candidatus Leptofilum sp. TaxID=3241576 RepID=UPI003B5B862A